MTSRGPFRPKTFYDPMILSFVNRRMIWEFFCDSFLPNQSAVHYIQKGMIYFRHIELGQKTQVTCFRITEVTKMSYPNRTQKASKMSFPEPSA